MKLAQKRLELELQAKTTTTQNAAEKAGKEKAATAMKVAHAEHMLKKQQQSAKHAEKQAALASEAVATALEKANQLAVQEKLAEKNVLELQEKLKAAELAIAEAKRVKSDPKIAKEVATKKAIAVVSTTYVKNQAEAKVIEL